MAGEQRQILEMLAEGKITAEEAERLLAKIGHAPSAEPAQGGPPKYLRVRVDSSDGDKVNIRVPLGLIRTGIKLKALLPDHATEGIAKTGLNLEDLADLQGEELIEALRELEVNVDSEDGDVVRIFCE